MKFSVNVILDHISGPEQDEDTMIDAFAAAIGRDNTATPPLQLKIEPFEEEPSVYEVKLIDA